MAAVFLALGGWNVYTKVKWKDPTDGVIWEKRPEGLTATKVIENSPADLNGIRKGDILVKINDISVQTKIDVAKNLWIAWNTDQNLSYQILREGEAPLTPTFFPTRSSGSSIAEEVSETMPTGKSWYQVST